MTGTETVVLRYGRGKPAARLDNSWRAPVVRKPPMPVLDAPRAAVAAALAQASLAVRAARARPACIAICDVTRPVPNDVLLPALLRALLDAGLGADAITVLVATGLRRPNEAAEGVHAAKARQEAGRKPLNSNGHEPFCQFPEPELPTASGVYAVVIDRKFVAHVGLAEDLRRRWRGYARIQPANCYRGGQPTNCKINNAILMETLENRTIDLWIRETEETQRLESMPIREFDSPWNARR